MLGQEPPITQHTCQLPEPQHEEHRNGPMNKHQQGGEGEGEWGDESAEGLKPSQKIDPEYSFGLMNP